MIIFSRLIFVSVFLFIVAILLGIDNINGILMFIGLFLGVPIVICIVTASKRVANEEKQNYNDLGISSVDDGKARALSLIDKFQWTQTGSMQSKEKRYITFRHSSNNLEDFDWLVKFISHCGIHAEILDPNYKPNNELFNKITDNPYAMMAIRIGDSWFKCTKVNSDYTTNEIYRFPKNDAENRKIVEGRYTKYEELNSNTCSGTIDIQSDNIIRVAQQLKDQYQHLLTDIKEDAEEVKPIEEQDTILLDVDNSTNTTSDQQDKQRAIDILNMQLWEKLNIQDKGRVQYVCRKELSPNPEDFKWVVGFLSDTGTPENPKNPHTYVITKLDGIEYKSIKVNKYFEGTVIYKMGDVSQKTDDFSKYDPIVKMYLTKRKKQVEARLTKDPMAHFNIHLINEKTAILEHKKEEYKKLRCKNDDETFISLYNSGLKDIDEYERQLYDLNNEIEEIEDEIDELNYELEEIREEIEDEIEDEEWERKQILFLY